MKTVVYVQSREFLLLAKRDELLSSVIGNNYFGMVPFRWPSREFDQVVALSKEFSGGVRLKPTFEFPKGVVDKMRFFDVSPLALCSWSDDDQEWARRKWDSLEFCKDGQYIKVYDEFHVSGLRPAYRKITSVDGPSVYLLSKDVVDAFHAEDFSGLDLGPVYDSSATLAYEHHCLLVARNFLPPFIANPSVKPHEDSGEMAWAVYGFLTYDPKDLVQALDSLTGL